MFRLLLLVCCCLMLQACAYTSHVPSSSGAHEVMANRRIDAPAYVRVDPELAGLHRKVSMGYVCGAHKYSVDIGPAITESILRTMEGAFRQANRVEARSEAKTDGYFLDFQLSDFASRLRFDQGFWTVTSEANTEISIRATAYDAVGQVLLKTTARGEARADNSIGGCNEGEGPVTEASTKAVQRAMEDLVQKMINSRALTEK